MDEAPKSDFSKIVQKQWQEDQLKDQIARLEEEKENLRRELKAVKSALDEREKQFQELHAAATREVDARNTHIKNLEQSIQSKDDLLSSLKRDNNMLRAAIEEERSKSLGQFISGKFKKK